MDKKILISALREISSLESDRFKSKAYLNACMVLSSMTQEEFDERKSFLNIPGIGMSINTKILDFKKDGTLPPKLFKLREENKSYLDPSLYKVRKSFITRRIPYNDAKSLVDKIDNILTNNGIDCSLVYYLGSFRRHKALIADIDCLIVEEYNYINVVKILSSCSFLTKTVEGPMKTTFVFDNQEKTTIDVSWCSEPCLPYSILHFTGSAASNIRLRAKAQKMGFKLNQYGLELIDTSDVRSDDVENYIRDNIRTEEDIFKFLGEEYIEPENR